MRTLKDILEVPLEDLRKGIKQWVDYSCNEETTEDKPKEPVIPDDLAAVIEFNKAIAEKYQATGAESLLKHLVAQLAKERGIKDLDEKLDPNIKETIGECLFEEIKDVLKVSPEKQELLNLPKAERAEHVVTKVIEANMDAIAKIWNGDKEIVKELDKKVVESACGTVDENDLKFALRSMIQIELAKSQKEATDA
jgi:Asp-tRNA(Asn)/Glu-tRNA(Gln) amidotransferase B subunit